MRNYKNYNISPHKNSHHKCKLYINHKHRNSRVKPLNQCKSISNYFHEQFKNKNLGARKTFRLILIMSLSKVNCMQKKKVEFQTPRNDAAIKDCTRENNYLCNKNHLMTLLITFIYKNKCVTLQRVLINGNGWFFWPVGIGTKQLITHRSSEF